MRPTPSQGCSAENSLQVRRRRGSGRTTANVLAFVLIGGLALGGCALTQYERGNYYFEHGDYARSIVIYKNILKAYPKDKEVRNQLGVAYMKQGLFREAFVEFHTVLDQDPGYARAYFNLGLLYTLNQLYPLALSSYQKAVHLDPDLLEAELYLGNTYLALNRCGEAAAAYKKILQRDPDADKVIFNLALVYEKEGKKQDAIRTWQNYLTWVPQGEQAQMAKNHLRELRSKTSGREGKSHEARP